LQDLVKADFQPHTFADDGDQHVDRDSDPDLRLDCVLADAVEGLDAQVLFDPLEEQFYLPALFVDLRDGNSGQVEVIGRN
jgi:hypothetical protein